MPRVAALGKLHHCERRAAPWQQGAVSNVFKKGGLPTFAASRTFLGAVAGADIVASVKRYVRQILALRG